MNLSISVPETFIRYPSPPVWENRPLDRLKNINEKYTLLVFFTKRDLV